MNNYEDYIGKVFYKLCENSDRHGKIRVSIRQISKLTSITILMVKSVIPYLRTKLKAIVIESTYDTNDLDKIISFRILFDQLLDRIDQGGCHNVK